MDNVTTPPAVRRKTKPKGRHPHKALSAAFVRSAPAGRHCDGNGLYLYVQRTGTRSWIQRLVIRGRKQARANRKLARAGGRSPRPPSPEMRSGSRATAAVIIQIKYLQ